MCQAYKLDYLRQLFGSKKKCIIALAHTPLKDWAPQEVRPPGEGKN
jgi:hypothetical protein